MKELVSLKPYQSDAFRNIACADPHSELAADIAPSPETQAILKKFYYEDAPLGTLQSPTERILQRSTYKIIQEEISKKFQPENWYSSRFSDGSWAVLYTAKSEETALKEALHHAKQHFYKEELARNPFLEISRRVIHLHIKSKNCGDLTQNKNLDFNQLSSPNASSYPYCQKLAKNFRSKGAEVLKSPSAHDPGGLCLPIFNQTAIQKDFGHLKYMKCELSQESVKVFPEGATYRWDNQELLRPEHRHPKVGD